MKDSLSVSEFRDVLFETLKDATYTKEIDILIDSFLYAVSGYYDFDCTEVYLVTGDYLILRGIAGLDRYFVCKVAYPLNSSFAFLMNSPSVIIQDNEGIEGYEDFNRFSKMMVMPIGIYSTNFGVFVVRTKDEKLLFEDIQHEILNLLGHFAVYLNAVLNTFNYDSRRKQLAVIKEFYARVELETNTNALFDSLSVEVARIFDAKGCAFWLSNGENMSLNLRSSWGINSNSLPHKIDGTHPLFSMLINNAEHFYSTNSVSSSQYKDYFQYASNSLMLLMLVEKSTIVGLFAVSDKTPSATNPLGHFLEEDIDMFKKIGAQMAGLIMRERIFSDLDKAVKKNELIHRRLYILYEVTNALLGHSKLEDILFILLTSATIGEAFGFNRAFLYLYDSASNSFKGKMGVAPINEQDAYRIWNDITANKGRRTLMENILVGLSERDIHENVDLNMRLSASVIPADERCVLMKAIKDYLYPINIKNTADEKNNFSEFTDLFGSVPFAVIPVISQTKIIGVLIVDNPYSKMPIEDEDLNYLKMFASQAGIAIEYSFLGNEIAEREKELKEAHTKLDESQRLALIGEMSASVAHDLRNSIVTIGGFAARMRRMDIIPDTAAKYASIIHEEVIKLEEYLTKNLTFAKKIKLNLETVQVKRIVEPFYSIAEARITQSGKEAKIKIEIDKKLDTVTCDYSQIHEALLNILLNAIDAIPQKDASIIIKARENTSDVKDRAYLEITITNTHSYIEDDDLKKIFDPFFTTKSSGVGLGLATTRRIVKAHGGDLSAASKRGENYDSTTFRLTIPIN